MPLFPNQKPKRPRGLSWDHIKLEPGKSWRGWLAGPVVTVHCHYPRLGTKPCRREFSSGDLPCPFCDAAMEAQEKTYCPLWSESGTPSLAVVGERYRELAAGIEHMSPVRVTKVISRGCPIRVECHGWTESRPILRGSQFAEQDITPWLLRVWGDDAIRQWVAEHPVSDNTLSPAPAIAPEVSAASAADVAALPLMLRAAATRRGTSRAPNPTDSPPAFDLEKSFTELAIQRPNIAAALNGTHKKEAGKKPS